MYFKNYFVINNYWVDIFIGRGVNILWIVYVVFLWIWKSFFWILVLRLMKILNKKSEKELKGLKRFFFKLDFGIGF